MAMENDDVMELDLGEEIQVDPPRCEEEATAGQRPGGSTQGVASAVMADQRPGGSMQGVASEATAGQQSGGSTQGVASEAGDGISALPVGDLVRVLLAGGLTSTITKIAKQQAMLVAGELSEAPVASTSSRRSDVPEPEASGSGVKAYIDTGCEANLMALATAERLGLAIDPNGAGQLLQGFGGGHALSRGSVSFEMTLAGCQIELTALVTEADMGQIELHLGQATLNTPGVTMVVRGGRIYLTTKPNIEEFFANITLEEDGGRCRVILAEDVTLLPDSVTNVDVEVHRVPGVEYFMDKKSFPHRRSAILIPAGVLKGERGRINCPKRMLTRPVDDALSQVVRSEALVPAGTVIPTKAGETDQPMADDVCNHTMAGEGVADLVIAGESNAATASGQKRVNLGNDSIGTNREVRGDNLAQESPTAGVTRKKRKMAGGHRWRPEVTRRSERLLQRTLTTVGAKTSGMTRMAVESDFHESSTGATRGQADQAGKSTHTAGDPPTSGEAHDQAGHLSGRTQSAMDGDVHNEHGDARGQPRASGGTALSGEALGYVGSYATASNACRSMNSDARDAAGTALDSDALREVIADSGARVPPNTVDTCDRQNKSYSSAWVNGVSVRSNFTQTILDHEKSPQHISASHSYNNWLQGNTIDTLLKGEIDSKITFWRDVLHRIINVIITLVSCNLPLRGHDSDSGNFMAISRLLSNYDATLKELLLKPKGEINYLSPTIQNEIISLLVTVCSAADLKTVILNLTKEYGIDLTKCRGQGYDGVNVMSGVYGGLQTLIKQHAPNADYVHCAAHALNLVLNDFFR
nr:unnamed protein product [Callosobruchus analis]